MQRTLDLEGGGYNSVMSTGKAAANMSATPTNRGSLTWVSLTGERNGQVGYPLQKWFIIFCLSLSMAMSSEISTQVQTISSLNLLPIALASFALLQGTAKLAPALQ